MRQFLGLLFSLCIAASLSAQVIPDPVFQHISPSQLGLKSFSWHDWDRNGLMWGTYKEGFYSYDGYTTKKYKVAKGDTSYLSDKIFLAALDSKNNLWLSYDDASGLTRYNTLSGKKNHYRSDSADQKKLPKTLITGIKEDRKGNIWVLTWGGGIVKPDPESGQCKRYVPHTPQTERQKEVANRVRDMIELPDGRFLVVFFTNEDFDYPPVYFDPKTGTFTPFPIREYISEAEDKIQNISFALRICHFVYQDSRENLWFGTYSGLIFFDAKTHQFQRVSGVKRSGVQNQDNARAYVVDENERLWIATPNSGVMVVDTKTREVKYVKHDIKVSTSVADNNIRMLKKDPDGNIWVGTIQAISIYNPLIQQFDAVSWSDMSLEFTDRSQQRVPVNQLLVGGNGTMYITSYNGINIYDAEKKQFIKKMEPASHLPKATLDPLDVNGQNHIGDIKRIADGKFIVISSENVPAIWNAAPDNFQVPVNWNKDSINTGCYSILFRHVNQEKSLYLSDGCNGYIYHYNATLNKLERFYKLGFRHYHQQNYSYVLPDGKWLLAYGEREFCILDPVKKQHKLYGPDHQDAFFPDSTIKTAYLDKKGTIWFATANGLYTFDETSGKTEHISKQLGWPEAPVNALTEDKNGIFWIALDRQLLKWDPKTNKTFLFGSELGLKTGDFISSIAQRDDKGKIYMANVNGILIFDPARIQVPPTIPKLMLSALSIREDTLNRQRLNAFTAEKPVLNWNDNFLNFEFASNQIYTPLPHQFYYRLLGLDSTWQANGISNKIRYTNLAAGSYVLEVKIKNAYGATSSVLQIPFEIRPPFWLTWWFYVIVIGVIAFAGYKMVKYRERAFIRKQEMLEERIRERTAEVVAKAEEINHQKDIILEKNKELTDSIQYALRIQQSILPDDAQIRNGLGDYFIFFKPKDIVSGDFYWYSKQQDSILWAVVDCTGHGVPGGFMSMLGSGLLNQIVNEELKLRPDEVLNHLRDRVIIALKQTGAYGESKDGMDITLCRYIPSEKKIQFAGAHNPLYILRNSELIELPGDKQPIGIHIGEKKAFALHETELQSGDMIYMSSDGYADQFGGEKGNKFKSGNLEKLFVKLGNEPVHQQLEELVSTFTHWKEGYEQLDDVCVFGVRIG
jgi:serine phosphatase RsbU (regulator of sigma subunit)/ligand-binding sensor domain-containing protein